MYFLFLCWLSLADWKDDIVEGSLNGYFTYEQMKSHLDSLESQCSECSTGNLNSGQIYYGEINIDSPLQKSSVLITAAQFAGYPNGPQLALYILSYLANEKAQNEDLQEILMKCKILVVPVMNPTAYGMLQQEFQSSGEFTVIYKNLEGGSCENPIQNGVNLNRNWDFQWSDEIDDQCDQNYPGSSSGSQQEIIDMKAKLSNQTIDLWIHLDRQGGAFIRPFTFDKEFTYDFEDGNIFYDQMSIDFTYAQDEFDNPETGTLIDYAYNQKIISVQYGPGTQRVSDNILSVLQDSYEKIQQMLQSANYEVSIEVASLSDQDCGNSYICESFNSTQQFLIYSLSVGNTGSQSIEFDFQIQVSTSSVDLEIHQLVYQHWKIGNSTNSSSQIVSNLDNTQEASASFTIQGFTEGTLDVYIEFDNEDSDFDVNIQIEAVPTGVNFQDYPLLGISVDQEENPNSSGGGSEDESDDQDNARQELHDGTVAGIIIALLLVLGVVLLLVLLIIRVRKKGNEGGQEQVEQPERNSEVDERGYVPYSFAPPQRV